jgi:hypothetical protein
LQHQKWEQHNLQGKVTEIATDIVVEKAIMPNASVTVHQKCENQSG